MKRKIAIILTLSWILPAALCAQVFHNAPASSAAMTNPLAADSSAAASGKKLYSQNCAQCHGNNLQGMGPAPSLDGSDLKDAKPGEVFWLITNGDLGKRHAVVVPTNEAAALADRQLPAVAAFARSPIERTCLGA